MPPDLKPGLPKFGIQIRNFPSELDDSLFERICQVAKEAERLGFDSIWMIDHLELRPPISYESQPIPECWITLVAIAESTERIALGPLVSCVQLRQPAYLLELVIALNEICSSRLNIGLGAGWFDQEFRSYGIPFPPPAERLKRVAASARLIKDHFLEPTHPQLWIGGSGPKRTMKLVAKFADACNLFGDPASVSERLHKLDEYCLDEQRSKDEIVRSKHSNVIIGESSEQVTAKVRKIISDESKINSFAASNLMGTPQECIRQLKNYIDVGVNYFTLSFPDLFEFDSMKLFKREVVDRFCGSAGRFEN